MKPTTNKYLNFTTHSLNLIYLWDKHANVCVNLLREHLFALLVVTATFPIQADLAVQFQENQLVLTSINENLVAMSALLGSVYLTSCFVSKKEEIKKLVDELESFEQFCDLSEMSKADAKATFYTKLFLIYGISGNLCYAVMPFLTFNECTSIRSDHMMKYGVPCGLVIVRFVLPFKFDASPTMEIVVIYQIFICLFATVVVVYITMLLCGLLIHLRTQLMCLNERLADSCKAREDKVGENVKFCVKFHTKIIKFVQNVNNVFGTMMILHLTLTSFIISLLGLEMMLVDDTKESFRFAMHLAGWLVMLFMICYYGQTLMDESLALSFAVYSTPWYSCNVKIQKDFCLILYRSQKPLTLTALNLGIMCFPTFLAVMKSAYSYFTLLLKLKS